MDQGGVPGHHDVDGVEWPVRVATRAGGDAMAQPGPPPASADTAGARGAVSMAVSKRGPSSTPTG